MNRPALFTRELAEALERDTLSPRAAFSSQSRGRERAEPPCDLRPAFQRDRDRILHSKSFRRLMHKTQVFLAPASEHYRTRLTHTLEVSQISRAIARALRLNEDLTEAIALGHDLGHTPFGHAGEDVLHRKIKGGFRHSEQSLRVVDVLEKDGQGLNLTFEVRNGILSHSKSRRGVIAAPEMAKPATLEAQVIRVSDSIAFINHDLQDAMRAGLIMPASLPDAAVRRLGETPSQRINAMVMDVVSASRDSDEIRMSPEVLDATEKLRVFLFEKVYTAEPLRKAFIKAERLLEGLFDLLRSEPEVLARLSRRDPGTDPERALCDFLSGMTDRYALDLYAELILPHPWEGAE